MTGNELARRIVSRNQTVLGFDNFFASSLDTVKDIVKSERFIFLEYDLNNKKQMDAISRYVREHSSEYKKVVFINCAAVVHTEYFCNTNAIFETNVNGMKAFLERAIELEVERYINCSSSEIYSMHSSTEDGGVKESDYTMFATAEHSQRTSYAAGKLFTEFFMKDTVGSGRIKGCSIRFANDTVKTSDFQSILFPTLLRICTVRRKWSFLKAHG